MSHSASNQTPVETWVVGRSPQCDLCLDHPQVSSRHCRMIRQGGAYFLEDLQSTNGTFVNGQRIRSRVSISRNDEIRLGPDVLLPWPEPDGDSKPGRSLTIGRLPENDIVLDYPVVSGRHARISFQDGSACIEDLGSSNGTALGRPDRLIQKSLLSPDDIVYFGTLPVPASQLLQGRFQRGLGAHESVHFEGQSLLMGRDPGCGLALDSPTVSWHHARFVRNQAEPWMVEDLGSSNGTFVNGQRVEQQAQVRSGDRIELGSLTLLVTAEGGLKKRDYRGDLVIEARHISVDVPGKRLIEDVSLTIYPSELVGLMGPSGAGKTTLMTAINGYMPPAEGQVLFNGRDLYAHYDQFRLQIGYVPQDDIMHRDLTVWQALYFTARLRLPKDMRDEEIRQRIEKVLSQLGLQSTENVLIGSPAKKGISGGQRKRVNLAMELLTDPSVLFLDEPTSGLSSEDALMVMKMLRRLAEEGKTILITIHQPSQEVYRLMDNLVLIAKDPDSPLPARLVYFGAAYPDSIRFFNPDRQLNAEPSPDLVLRGLSRESAQSWFQRYDRSEIRRRYIDERSGSVSQVPPPDPASGAVHRGFGMLQWWTLVKRCLAIKLKDTLNTSILALQAPIIALLIVLVFAREGQSEATYNNWLSGASASATTLFLLVISALWFGCSNSAREIVGEWAVYQRERMINLKIPSYVLSKFTVLGALCMLQCLTLLGIVHKGGDLKGDWLPMLGMLILTSWVGMALGLILSALAKSSEVAISLVPLVLLPMVILGGMMSPPHEMKQPIQSLSHSMVSRWAFEGLLLLENERHPHWTPTEQAQALGGPPATRRDLAESYFPLSERSAASRPVWVQTLMLCLLLTGISLILRRRDVH